MPKVITIIKLNINAKSAMILWVANGIANLFQQYVLMRDAFIFSIPLTTSCNGKELNEMKIWKWKEDVNYILTANMFGVMHFQCRAMYPSVIHLPLHITIICKKKRSYLQFAICKIIKKMQYRLNWFRTIALAFLSRLFSLTLEQVSRSENAVVI